MTVLDCHWNLEPLGNFNELLRGRGILRDKVSLLVKSLLQGLSVRTRKKKAKEHEQHEIADVSLIFGMAHNLLVSTSATRAG